MRLRPRVSSQPKLTDSDILCIRNNATIEPQADGRAIVKYGRQTIRISRTAANILSHLNREIQYKHLKSALGENKLIQYPEEQIATFLEQLSDRGIIQVNGNGVLKRKASYNIHLPAKLIEGINHIKPPQTRSDSVPPIAMLAAITWNTLQLAKTFKSSTFHITARDIILTCAASAGIVLLHELGHVAAMRCNGVQVAEVSFRVTAPGVVQGETRPASSIQNLPAETRLGIILAGPLVDTLSARAITSAHSRLANVLGIAIIVVNLLPIGNSDGKRALRIALDALKQRSGDQARFRPIQTKHKKSKLR